MSEHWRSVVVRISRHLRKRDCKALRFIYQLPDSCCSCKHDQHLEPLDELQQRGKFSHKNPEGLELILKGLDRFDLATIVKDSKKDIFVRNHGQLDHEKGKHITNAIEKDLRQLLLAEEDHDKKHCLSTQLQRIEELDTLLSQALGKEGERIPEEESLAGHHGKTKLAAEGVQVLPTGTTQAMKPKGHRQDERKDPAKKQPMIPPSHKSNPITANSDNQQRSSPPPQSPAPQPPIPLPAHTDPDYDEVDTTTDDEQKENIVHYYASTDLINRTELQHPIPETQRRHVNVPDAVSQSAPSSPLSQHTQFSAARKPVAQKRSRIPRMERRIPLVPPPPEILKRRISKSSDALDTTSSDYSGSSSDYTGSGSADSGISDVGHWKAHQLSPQKDCLIRPSAMSTRTERQQYTSLSGSTISENQHYTKPGPKPAPRKIPQKH